MDRGHIGLHYDRRDRKVNESSGVALLEPSRSIRRFLRFLQNMWQRGSETSGLAMLLVRAWGAETFVPWTLLERAGVQRQTVLATLRIIYPYEEMRSHPIPHGVTPMLLIPPIPSPFSVDHFRDVSARTADIETLGAIYIDCGVPVMLGGPIGSETRQRWSCVLRYHSWDGLVITTSSTVGLPEGKSSYFWSRADFNCIHATCRGVIGPLEWPSPARGDVLTIELESGTATVSRVLYRLAPAEMAELNKHMKDSSDNRFIRPSNSPWGAPVLFVVLASGHHQIAIVEECEQREHDERLRIVLIDSRLQFGYCIPSGNANQVADALSRRRNDVSGTKEVQEMTGTLASLRLCAVTAKGETAVSDMSDGYVRGSVIYHVIFELAFAGVEMRHGITSYNGIEDRTALHLAEFAYIDNYRSSIEMTPYEAIYGRPCRIPLCCTKGGLKAHKLKQLKPRYIGLYPPVERIGAVDCSYFISSDGIGQLTQDLNSRLDPRTVNFISVLPLIQKEPGNGRDIIGKISMPDFQIIHPIIKSTYVCVYDQPGNEATLVKQMVLDQKSSGVALLEPSRCIRRFLRFLQNPWQRGSETSGLAMLLVRACGAETFVPWTLLERAGVQRQTVLATLRIIYPYEEMRSASCLFMLELNFHSGSSITQVSGETDEQE
ncbi:hypothetical protein YC2023_082876 [Brassica napus]